MKVLANCEALKRDSRGKIKIFVKRHAFKSWGNFEILAKREALKEVLGENFKIIVWREALKEVPEDKN